MSSIDERIVEMKFNNSQFQQGIKTTMDSLASLKTSLNLDSAKSGFSGLSDIVSKFSFGNISETLSSIKDKFTLMSGAAIVALGNIATQAIQTGLSMVKSLTLEPLKAGMDEYELKMGSIQTILANTSKYGTTLDDVNKALDDLNTYSDKTIYNFGEMTKNIGLFTNAGIKLEDATSMIKGFSNAAAASGVTADKAAGAAYQLSQALSSGEVRLMDWRSLSNAGMGSNNMKQGLVDIAKAMGTLGKETPTGIMNNWNDSLKSGWLSADVMSKYLKIMAGDMDAAAISALGLSDAQVATLLAQQKTAEDAATKVRTYTQLVSTVKESIASGWSSTFSILIGNFNEATDLFTGIYKSIDKMVSASSDARNILLGDWKKLGGRTVLIEALTNVFSALGNIIKTIGDAFADIFPPTTAKQLFAFTEGFKKFTEGMKASSGTLSDLKRTLRGLFAIFGIVWEIVKAVGKAFFDLLGFTTQGSSGILKFTGNIGDFIYNIQQAIKNGTALNNFFKGVADFIKIPIQMIKSFIAVLGLIISGVTDFSKGPLSQIGDNIKSKFQPLSKIGDSISNAWENVARVFGKIGTFFKPVTDAIGKMFAGLSPLISDAFKSLNYNNILAGVNTGLLAGLVIIIKKIFAHGLKLDLTGGFFENVNQIFGQLTGTLTAFQSSLKAKTLLTIAAAIGIITLSVIGLSLVDPAKLTAALAALTLMFTQLLVAMSMFTKIVQTKGMAKLPLLAASMILFGIAINVLTTAVIRLAQLDWQELTKGLVGVTALLAAVVIASRTMSNNSKGMYSAAVAMIAISIAIKILASAVSDLSKLGWEEMAKGLVGIGVLLAQLAIFSKFASATKGAIKNGVGLILLAVAIKILASAVAEFGNLDAGKLQQGLMALGAVLIMLTIFSKVSSNGASLIGVGVGMIILGAAIKIFAAAIGTLGNMPIDKLIIGLTAMAVMLGIVAVAMRMMPKNMLFTAVSLVIVAAALTIMAGALNTMGGMTWDEIGRGLVVLAASLAIIAGALYLMSGALPGAAALIIAAGALSIMAPVLNMFGKMSWEEIGKGLLMLAASLAIVAGAGYLLIGAIPGLLGLGAAAVLVGIGTLMAGAGILLLSIGLTALSVALGIGGVALLAFVVSLINLIPLIVLKIGEGIVALADLVGKSGPQFLAAFTVLLATLITAIVTVIPMAVNAIVSLITLILEALVKNVPKFVSMGMTIIISFLNGIAMKLPAIMRAATNVIVAFINGLADSLPRIIKAGINLVISFINGIADGIKENTAKFVAAGSKLFRAVVDGIAAAVKQGGKDIRYAGEILGQALLDGAKAALGIASPSKEFYKLGEFSTAGIANGLNDTSSIVGKAAENVGMTAVDGLNKSISSISDIAMANMDMAPTIRPVLDLSAVVSDSKEINSLLTPSTISVDSAYSKAASIAVDQKVATAEQAATQQDQTKTGDTNVTFVQNNTSPKALSAAELYRQTKNQISAARGNLAVV